MYEFPLKLCVTQQTAGDWARYVGHEKKIKLLLSIATMLRITDLVMTKRTYPRTEIFIAKT